MIRTKPHMLHTGIRTQDELVSVLIRSIAILVIATASVPATAGLLSFDGPGIVHGSVVSTIGNSGGVITDPDFILPLGLSSIQAINIGGGGCQSQQGSRMKVYEIIFFVLEPL